MTWMYHSHCLQYTHYTLSWHQQVVHTTEKESYWICICYGQCKYITTCLGKYTKEGHLTPTRKPVPSMTFTFRYRMSFFLSGLCNAFHGKEWGRDSWIHSTLWLLHLQVFSKQTKIVTHIQNQRPRSNHWREPDKWLGHLRSCLTAICFHFNHKCT